MCTAITHPVPDVVKQSFVIYWHPDTLTLSPERQSPRMSKITDDVLTRYGTGCFIICALMATAGVKALTRSVNVVWRWSGVFVVSLSGVYSVPPSSSLCVSGLQSRPEWLWASSSSQVSCCLYEVIRCSYFGGISRDFAHFERRQKQLH